MLRNRVRRRLRAALRELQAGGRLPGRHLPPRRRAELAELPWSELVELLEATIAEARS